MNLQNGVSGLLGYGGNRSESSSAAVQNGLSGLFSRSIPDTHEVPQHHQTNQPDLLDLNDVNVQQTLDEPPIFMLSTGDGFMQEIANEVYFELLKATHPKGGAPSNSMVLVKSDAVKMLQLNATMLEVI